MQKIDVETIYPQAEKDHEADKLERLCNKERMAERFADGDRLIR